MSPAEKAQVMQNNKKKKIEPHKCNGTSGRVEAAQHFFYKGKIHCNMLTTLFWRCNIHFLSFPFFELAAKLFKSKSICEHFSKQQANLWKVLCTCILLRRDILSLTALTAIRGGPESFWQLFEWSHAGKCGEGWASASRLAGLARGLAGVHTSPLTCSNGENNSGKRGIFEPESDFSFLHSDARTASWGVQVTPLFFIHLLKSPSDGKLPQVSAVMYMNFYTYHLFGFFPASSDHSLATDEQARKLRHFYANVHNWNFSLILFIFFFNKENCKKAAFQVHTSLWPSSRLKGGKRKTSTDG